MRSHVNEELSRCQHAALPGGWMTLLTIILNRDNQNPQCLICLRMKYGASNSIMAIFVSNNSKLNKSKQKKRINITLREVADKAGVSLGTASNALRKKDVVSKKTHTKVIETAEELGYVYNRYAAQLRTNRSNTISLIVPNISNPFFSELTDEVEQFLEKEDCRLLLSRTSDSIDRQTRCIKSSIEYGVDGILLCPAIGTKSINLRSIGVSGIPLVLFTRRVANFSADYVGVDNVKGAVIATEYLLSRGHKRIAFVGGSSQSTTRVERFSGYRQALTKSSRTYDSSIVVECESTIRGGYKGIEKMLQYPNPPTAVVCYNDIIAFGVILGLWAQKLTPGREVSVVGFDDISTAAIWMPPLTTISNPPATIAEEVVQLLFNRIKKPILSARKSIISPRLVPRLSCNE